MEKVRPQKKKETPKNKGIASNAQFVVVSDKEFKKAVKKRK